MPQKKIRSFGGVGKSKNFGAPEAERPITGVDRMLACHINGVKIANLNLRPEVLCALDYYATDEGIAEKNARPNVREPSGITLGKDEFAKALDERRDDVKRRDMPLSDSRDPLKEVADKYAKPGMKAKFLSARRIQEGGGTGDYEVVKKANGDPVKVKGMILGHTPIEVAEARNKSAQKRGNQMIGQITKQYKQEGGVTAVVDQ
jgi:hypothetical protein